MNDSKTNKTNRKEKQDKFLGTCKVCGQTLSYIPDTNVIVCKNPGCPGIMLQKKNGDKHSIPINRLLNDRGVEIAQTLF